MNERYQYAAPVDEFVDVVRTELPVLITTLGGDASRTAGEPASWANSLPALAAVLERAERPGLQVILEYNPFQSGHSRVDAIVCGQAPDGRDAYLVVELKQWSGGRLDRASGMVFGTGARYERAEGMRAPLDQAADYVSFIRGYTDGFDESEGRHVIPVAFLHNATITSAATLRCTGPDGHTFTGDQGDVDAFIDLVRATFADASGTSARDALLEARYRQGPGLLRVASAIFDDRRSFPLSDRQFDAYASIRHAVDVAVTTDEHRVVVVRGGPGSGKTWLALHLLAEAASQQHSAIYATNSTSLREALRTRVRARTRTRKAVEAMISSGRTFWKDDTAETLDLLLVDEAHRLTTWTVRTGHNNSRVVQAELERTQMTQLRELKRAARVLVLFLDEKQSITPKDAVTRSTISALVEAVGCEVDDHVLDEQHRAGGSLAYEAWVDSLLAGRPTTWHDEPSFTVRVAGSPDEMDDELEDLADSSGTRPRVLAGFCWKWQPWPRGAMSIVDVPKDIEIGTWSRRWNLRESISGFPKHENWAETPSGAEQVGSSFTSQGFEFPFCGVIIGDDMRWDPKFRQLETDPKASRYDKLTSASTLPEHRDALIRNQYRVLLTRAMKGVVIYSTDPATRTLLKAIVNPRSEQPIEPALGAAGVGAHRSAV